MRRGSRAAMAMLVLALAFLVGPFAVVFIAGFSDGDSLAFPPQSWSLRWMTHVLAEEAFQRSFITSLWVGFGGTTQWDGVRVIFDDDSMLEVSQVVLATGAIERPLVFAENDRPGVMLAGAVRTYVNRYGARPGNRAVVFTNNDSAYRAAIDASDGGIDDRYLPVRHQSVQ